MDNSARMFRPEGLRLVSYCPLCHLHYNVGDAKILEEHEDTHLMHVVCKRCSSSILVLMLTGELGVSSVGLITDLTSDDVVRFKDQSDIQDDDVIALHEQLHQDLLDIT